MMWPKLFPAKQTSATLTRLWTEPNFTATLCRLPNNVPPLSQPSFAPKIEVSLRKHNIEPHQEAPLSRSWPPEGSPNLMMAGRPEQGLPHISLASEAKVASRSGSCPIEFNRDEFSPIRSTSRDTRRRLRGALWPGDEWPHCGSTARAAPAPTLGAQPPVPPRSGYLPLPGASPPRPHAPASH